MRVLAITCFFALGVALLACGDDEGSPTTNASSTSTTSTSSAGGAGGQSCMADLTGQGGGDAICMEQASDSECISCTRMSCCSELQACLPNEKCRCLLECFLAGCDAVGCLAECGQDGPTMDLIACVSGGSSGGAGGNPGCPVCLQ